MPDICDIDELESGERREGLFVTIPFTIARGVTG
jgi:Na+/melibiose symporter-like transporter